MRLWVSMGLIWWIVMEMVTLTVRDTPNADAVGLSLGGVEFGLAIINPVANQPLVAGFNWIGLEARAGSVQFVGIPDLTVSSANIEVSINQVSGVAEDLDPGNWVIDFAADPLDIITGTGTAITLMLPGTSGSLIRAFGDVEIAILDVFHLNGSVGFEQSRQPVQLADGSTVEADILALGGTNLSAFVGSGGPYLVDSNDDGVIDASDSVNDNAVGLSLDGVEFAFVLAQATPGEVNYAGLDWLALQASAASAEFVGIPEITAALSDVEVSLNQVNNVPADQAEDLLVIDFGAVPVDVITGTDTAKTLNMEGGLGELIRASGDIELAISDFFYVAGSVWFRMVRTVDSVG